MVSKDIEQILQKNQQQNQQQLYKQKSIVQCPFSNNNTTNFQTDKCVQIKNLLTNKTLKDTLHQEASKQICPQDYCNGSIMRVPNLNGNRSNEQILIEAEDFLNQYFTSKNSANTLEHKTRLEEVRKELNETNTINYNYDELTFGTRTAWRNASRCIGRKPWNKLVLNDARHIKSTKEMFEEACKHIKYATNNGNIRLMITLYPNRVPYREDYRLWNSQFISFAGYIQEDGTILGDPINVEFTQVCLKLGWNKKIEERTPFDVLPLVFSGPNEGPTLYEIPEELVLKVNIRHPTNPFLDDLNLQWYALPVVSSLKLDVGGIEFPASPFNGWFVSTEIATRDFLDTNRYNLGRKLAHRLNLNTSTTSNLWLDRVALELNVAVLHSFQKNDITLVDHHTASESFMKHLEKETKLRGGCPADWVWITPPMSSSLTKVFHQEMLNYHLKPSYEVQEPVHKVYDWKRKPVDLKYSLKSVSMSILFNNLMHKITLKKRPNVTILYATETGVSENFANKLGKMLKNTFNCKVICMENYDVKELKNEKIIFFVASTFDVGDCPDNAISFWKYVNLLQPDAIDLSNLNYAVFALGSSQYSSTFCEFGLNLDKKFKKLGAKQLANIGLADELKDQEQTFLKWSKVTYENICKKYDVDVDSNNLEVLKDEDYNPGKVRLIEVDSNLSELHENLSKMHSKQVQPLNAFSVEQLLPAESERQCLLVKLKPRKDSDKLDYLPGDHLAVFPKNPKELVDKVLSHLQPDTVGMYKEDIQKTTYKVEIQSNGKWVPYLKLPQKCTLREALTNYLDISGAPSKKILKAILPYVTDLSENQHLQKLINTHSDYEEWKNHNYPTLADLFDYFPSLKIGPKLLFTQLSLLQPRYYSISSSLESSPNEIHLTMTVIEIEKKGTIKKGLCTNYFAEKPTESVNCFIRKVPHFHMPKDLNKPIIMVSSGCGIAPFRSFWHQSIINQNTKSKSNKLFLFHGCRNRRLDNIYEFEYPELLSKGILLDIFYAYSRDSQYKKKYVQDQIYKQKSLVYNLLENENADIYVCGSSKMADGVRTAIKKVFIEEGKLSENETEIKLQKLFDDARYHEDVFGNAH